MKTELEIQQRITDKVTALAAQDALIASMQAKDRIPPETAAMVFALRREIEALNWVLR